MIAQQVAQTDNSTAIAVALIGLAGILVTAVATALVSLRNGRRTKDVKAQVGDTNGQGTLAEMVGRIDIATIDMSRRLTNMDQRHLAHEADDRAALEAIHEELAVRKETIDAISRHIFGRPAP